MRLIIVIVSFLLLITAAVSHAQERDGADWQGRNESWKYAYITGILDGITTGSDMTMPVLSKGSIILYKEDKACLEKAEVTFGYNASRFLFGLSLKDVVEGLDAFYKDPANSAIPVNRAVRVWVMARKGVPEADRLLEDYRREWGGAR